jgi:clan AA aspartic protease (TIGR02281 family)
MKTIKKNLLLFALLLVATFPLTAQTADVIVSELDTIFRKYRVSNNRLSKAKGVNIWYREPILSIKILLNDRGWNEVISFDILKTTFSTVSHYRDKYPRVSFQAGERQNIKLVCTSGIDVSDGTYSKLPREYTFFTDDEVVAMRIVNGFQTLQPLAKEKQVQQSAPHIFDNAKLNVLDIAFSEPTNTGKLNANTTGLLQVKICNESLNDALAVNCILQENEKSDVFEFEPYSSVDRIKGNTTQTINIPIKATDNVDNSTYTFTLRILYDGSTIKEQDINIAAYNKRKTVQGVGSKIIKMRKMAGNTFQISCKVNGLPLDFIFDTGATDVTLSLSEALFMLKNGYLSENDILGKERYQTASGKIQMGTKIILRKIEISGNVLHNIEASIIHSDNAPLLLGQSALKQLGKIQIDYQQSTLTIIKN